MVTKKIALDKLIYVRDRILTNRIIQIIIFLVILAFSIILFLYFRKNFDMEQFLTYGYLGVFITNLICCASILFPIPGEAINIAAGTVMNPLFVGLIAAVGATIGEPTSYLAGSLGRKIGLTRYLEKYEDAQRWMQRYGSFAIFLFALLPILIFDLIGIVAGTTRYPLWKFLAACFVGRLLRCLVESYFGFGVSSVLDLPW